MLSNLEIIGWEKFQEAAEKFEDDKSDGCQ